MIDTVALWLIADLAEKDIFTPQDATAVLRAVEGLQELENRGWRFIPPEQHGAYRRSVRQTTE